MSSQHVPIACQSLTKAFHRPAVVDDLSFELEAGSITGFVGANGAGRTTTMRMILGLVTPSSGQALVNGVPYIRSWRSHVARSGRCSTVPALHPGHTARAHLGILATAAGLPPDRAGEALELVGLGEHACRRVGAFSLGMRQRLALAAAMLGDPPILLLDEPVNGLDPPGIMWMRGLLRRFAAEGRAVLVSSHLLGELAEVADRVIITDRGRLVADAPLGQLLNGEARVVEVRCADPAAMAETMRERGAAVSVDGDLLVIDGVSSREAGEVASAVGAGPVYWLTERAGSFEDAYFQLAGSLTSPRAARTDEGTGS